MADRFHGFGITNAIFNDDKYLKNNCLIIFYTNETKGFVMPRLNQIKYLAVLLMLMLCWRCDKDAAELPDTPILYTGDVYLSSGDVILSGKITQTDIKINDSIGFIIDEISESATRSFFVSADTIYNNNTFQSTLSSSLHSNSKYEVSAVFYFGERKVTGNKVHFTGFDDGPPQILALILPGEPTWGDTIKIVCGQLSAFTSDYSFTSRVKDIEYNFPILDRIHDTLLVQIHTAIPTFHPILNLKYFDAIVDKTAELKLEPPQLDSISPDMVISQDYFTIHGKYLSNLNIYEAPEIEIFKGDTTVFRGGTFPHEDNLNVEYFIIDEPGDYTIRVQYLDTISNTLPLTVRLTEYFEMKPTRAFYGDTIYVTGRWFPNALSAMIENEFVTEIYRDRDSLVYVIPSEWTLDNKDGYINVHIANFFYDGLNNGFFINDSIPLKKPVINSVNPSEGLVGTEITITGDYFSENYRIDQTDYTTVWFNNIRAEALPISRNTIHAIIPVNAPLNANIRVENNGISSEKYTGFALTPARVTGLSTTDAQYGSLLEIYGENFPENKAILSYQNETEYIYEKPIRVFFGDDELEIMETTQSSVTVKFTNEMTGNITQPLKIQIGEQEIETNQLITYTTPWVKLGEGLPGRSGLDCVNGITVVMNGTGYIGLDGEYQIAGDYMKNFSNTLLEFNPDTRNFSNKTLSPVSESYNGVYPFGFSYGNSIVAFLGNTLYEYKDEIWEVLPEANKFPVHDDNIYGGFQFGDNIYIINAKYPVFGNPSPIYESKVYKYNLTTHEDTFLNNLFPDISCQIGITYNDKVYLLGRRNQFWMFDPFSETWTALADFPVNILPWVRYALFEFKGIIYACSEEKILSYDPTLDSWTTYKELLPFDGQYSYALSFDDKCFVGGGLNAPEKTRHVMFEFFPEYLTKE